MASHSHVIWKPEKFNQELDDKANFVLKECADNILVNAFDEVPVASGRLQSSLRSEVNKSNKTAYVGSDLNYSTFVELGTGKRAANPFLQTSLELLQSSIDSILKRAKIRKI
jgi:HK97 gp10 family phage protein